MNASRVLSLAGAAFVFLFLAAAPASAQETPNHAGIVSRLRREPVASSNVASVGYSRRLHVLEIEFSRGAIYRFLEVPRATYLAMMAAESKGRFFAMNIRGKYRFVRVRRTVRSAHERGWIAEER